jgi:aldose 1-epimerase
MAPFSNVIENGQLKYGDTYLSVPRNHPMEPWPIHGDAWLGKWEVDRVLPNAVQAHYAHDGGHGYPFRYVVHQGIALAANLLKISLRLLNHDQRPMPAGLGVHPYFRRPKSTLIHAAHGGRWTGSGATTDLRFRSEEELPEQTIDDCFMGWKGFASIRWPQDRVELSIRSSACALVIFSPAGADFVCVEPATHVNDGINSQARGIKGTGIEMLDPGACLELEATVRADIG